MAIVVKWRKTGEYLSGFYHSRKGPRLAWSKLQSEGMLFKDIDGAKDCVKGHLGKWGFAPWQVRFVRLVPKKRNAPPRPDVGTPGDGEADPCHAIVPVDVEQDADPAREVLPTAADAVAGMLLRFGFQDAGSDLLFEVDTPETILGWIRRFPEQTPERDACIAAPEALAMGEAPTEGASLQRLRAQCYAAEEPSDAKARSVSRWFRACDALRDARDPFARGYLYGMRDAFRVAENDGTPQP